MIGITYSIVSAAIKYSCKIEHPIIQIGSTEENGKITYYIQDNGIDWTEATPDKGARFSFTLADSIDSKNKQTLHNLK